MASDSLSLQLAWGFPGPDFLLRTEYVHSRALTGSGCRSPQSSTVGTQVELEQWRGAFSLFLQQLDQWELVSELGRRQG